MKLTKQDLKDIIKEETSEVVSEGVIEDVVSAIGAPWMKTAAGLKSTFDLINKIKSHAQRRGGGSCIDWVEKQAKKRNWDMKKLTVRQMIVYGRLYEYCRKKNSEEYKEKRRKWLAQRGQGSGMQIKNPYKKTVGTLKGKRAERGRGRGRAAVQSLKRRPVSENRKEKRSKLTEDENIRSRDVTGMYHMHIFWNDEGKEEGWYASLNKALDAACRSEYRQVPEYVLKYPGSYAAVTITCPNDQSFDIDLEDLSCGAGRWTGPLPGRYYEVCRASIAESRNHKRLHTIRESYRVQPEDCDCRVADGTVVVGKGKTIIEPNVPSWAKPDPKKKWCPAPEHLYKQGPVGCNPHTGRWEAGVDPYRRTKMAPDEPNYKYRGEYGCINCSEEKDLIKKLLEIRKTFDLDRKKNQVVIDEINDLIYYLTGIMPLGKGLLAAWGYCKRHKRIVSLINRTHKRLIKKKGPIKRLIRFAHLKICKLPEMKHVRKNARAWERPKPTRKDKCSRQEYRKAFRRARVQGKKRFVFCGKVYSTALKK